MHSEKKYFQHVEPEALLVQDWQIEFDQVLSIPLYGEGDLFLKTVDSIPIGLEKILVILTLNAVSSSPAWVHQANQISRQVLENRFGKSTSLSLKPSLKFWETPFGKILLVDRAHEGCFFPPKKGVGLARKIGADLAWILIQQKKIKSRWIHCTDADALLPVDYFSQSKKEENKNIAALLYSFEHTLAQDPALAQACLLYEDFLQHYVCGLTFAGSPYAFHTIGSTVAISASHYAQALGFPDREAGEDFYLLNKLAKLGEIKSLEGLPLKLEGRVSDRVPFGTGKSLKKILEIPHFQKEYVFYHPDVFSYLKIWLKVLEAHAENLLKDLKQELHSFAESEGLSPSILLESLEKNNLISQILDLNLNGNRVSRLRTLHTWFDGFKTLKLIHTLREKLPSLPSKQALARSPWYKELHRNNT